MEEAERLLDGVLSGHPRELGALVARGTARALLRRLKPAVEDFSRAIEVEPRRGGDSRVFLVLGGFLPPPAGCWGEGGSALLPPSSAAILSQNTRLKPLKFLLNPSNPPHPTPKKNLSPPKTKRYPESWKRRGQSRSALGDHKGALSDLKEAIRLLPLFPSPDGGDVKEGQARVLPRRGGGARRRWLGGSRECRTAPPLSPPR